MTPKVAEFLNLGMRRDVADSKVGNQHVYENYNVRIDNNDGDTVYSATNERGNLNKNIQISGVVLGVCELLDGAVIFSKSTNDIITYIVRIGDEYEINKQYSGNLNFQTGGFFDTLVDYETENVTKVYWVDGVNQPRMITLQEDWSEYDDTSFDFVPEIDKFPHIYIEKEHTSGVGIFKAGIVQYFFTYSNIHGVETAVVYSSPLFYADHRKRAGKPDDFVECQFNIEISNISQKFDKINIYRAIRTSVNTEVEMVKIANIDINGDSTSIIDDYVGGVSVSPTDIFFKGGDRFVAGTLAAKDNTLFLGNINIDTPDYSDLNGITNKIFPLGFGQSSTDKILTYIDSNAFFNGNREITYTKGYANGKAFHSSNSYLKSGDYYNIGVQLQDKFGKWTEPILFSDFLCPSGIPSNGRIPKQLLNVNTSEISSVIKNKYKRIRAVACFPSENKRHFVAQGVLNPSVYCTRDRAGHIPDSLSSWFFRSIPPQNEAEVQTPTSEYLEYRHDYFLGSNDQHNCELQFMEAYWIIEENGGYTYSHRTACARNSHNRPDEEQIIKQTDSFAVDASICTLNSPDITDLGGDQEECNVSIVGYCETDRSVGEYKVVMQTTSNLSLAMPGFLIPENKIHSVGAKNHLNTWPLFFDSFTCWDSSNGGSIIRSQDKGVAWAVYPWQADRPLGNDLPGDYNAADQIISRSGTNEQLRGQYSKKILGNIRYCDSTNYIGSYNISNISDVCFYRGTASQLVRFPSNNGMINHYAGCDRVYRPNSATGFILRYCDGIHTPSNPYWTEYEDDAVPYSQYLNSNVRELFDGYIVTQGSYSLVALEPTIVRYKTTPHAIFKINPSQSGSSFTERVLPGYFGDSSSYSLNSLWINSTSIDSATPSLTDVRNATGKDRFWIGEITRDTPAELMFPSDINDRAFVPISDIYDLNQNDFNIELYGDVHYQRYDCLKSYPYSYDDKNQVIDVLSFMVESKNNLDGRYDKYVETEDVTAIDDSFFNLIDDAYNQKDNLFTYRIQEEWIKENKDFPNQFAWSQTKHPGEEIDTWTSINLASTYQADGALGEIQKIIKFGDSLFCFQDKGICLIMFNSNIQLASTSGVPIELANSGKVDGVRYLTNMEGCKNPWTIKSGIAGVYFVDDINHNIDKLSQNGVERLSEIKGFSDFTHNSDNQFRMTWYDNNKKDVHFVLNNKTIAYSEKLGEFTSFYDYGKANIAFNVGDNFNQFFGNSNDLFVARKGNYFYFFDEENPSEFSITYRMAPQPFEYKIFNTVDYLLRVTSHRGLNHDLVYDTGFHEIEVSTENGNIKQKIDKNDFATNMNQIKKFNIWRTNIPRFDYFRRADGTSIYLKLYAGPDEDGNAYQDDLADKRYELHNLRLSYLS